MALSITVVHEDASADQISFTAFEGDLDHEFLMDGRQPITMTSEQVRKFSTVIHHAVVMVDDSRGMPGGLY